MNAASEFLEILSNVPEDDFLLDIRCPVPGMKPYDTAAIATDLVPNANEYMRGGSSIRIVGNDGENVTSDGYPWTKDLMKWVEDGNHIEYLLMNPSKEAVDKLQEACAESSGQRGSLSVMTIDRDRPVDDEDQKFIDRWRSFHFVTFDHPKQLWVEGNHPEKSTNAENCAYYPPEAVEQTALWSVLNRQFEHIRNRYSKTLASTEK